MGFAPFLARAPSTTSVTQLSFLHLENSCALRMGRTPDPKGESSDSGDKKKCLQGRRDARSRTGVAMGCNTPGVSLTPAHDGERGTKTPLHSGYLGHTGYLPGFFFLPQPVAEGNPPRHQTVVPGPIIPPAPQGIPRASHFSDTL